MDKRILLGLCLILIASTVLATPVVEVTDPNGGETIQKGNVYSIDFTVHDVTNPQAFTAQFWYSNSPSAHTNLINVTPIDLMGGGYCAPSFQQESLFDYYAKYTKPLLPDASEGELHIIDWLDDSFGGKLMWFGYDGISNPSSGYVNTEEFTGVTRGEFINSTDLNNDFLKPPYDDPYYISGWGKVFYRSGKNTPSMIWHGQYYGGGNYYLRTYRQDWLYNDHFGTPIEDVNLFKWFDSTYNAGNYNCVMGAGNVTNQVEFTEQTQIFQYEGYLWVVAPTKCATGTTTYCSYQGGQAWGCRGCLDAYRYLGNDIWIRDTKFISNIHDWNLTSTLNMWVYDQENFIDPDCFTRGLHVSFYTHSGVLYAVSTSMTTGMPIALRWGADEKWHIVEDYNAGITAPFWNVVGGGGYATFAKAWEYNGYEYLFQQAGNDYALWTRRPFWVTDEERVCSYNWDTSNASVGQWYLDAVVTGDESGSDSSDDDFTIQTAPIPPVANNAWEVTGVSGISSVGLSLTSNDVNLVAQGTDVVFMVKHKRAEWDSLVIDVLYDNTDGRQYWVYKINCDVTSNCAAYQQGLWTFDNTLTYGNHTGGVSNDAITKFWSSTAGAYAYSYTHGAISTNGQITYYKLVYRLPIRNFDDLSDETIWQIQSIVPSHEIIDGGFWDYWRISAVTNINQYVIESIPQIDPSNVYEFQFTAYALGDQAIYIGDEGNWKTVNITSTPKRYSVQINDINVLKIKSQATTANTVYFSNVVLLSRDYFKTGLKLLKENHEPLDIWINPNEGEASLTVETGEDVNTERMWFTGMLNGQTFTVGDITTVSSISMKLWTDGSCDNPETEVVRVRIMDLNGFEYLRNVTVPISQLNVGTPTWVNFPMDNVDMSHITTAFIVFGTDCSTGQVYAMNDDGNPYSGGQAMYGESPNLDWFFKVYGNQFGESYQYINEGSGFRFNTIAYDREQKLTKYKVEVYAYGVSDENKIQIYEKDLASPIQEYFFPLDDLVAPVYVVKEPTPVGSILGRTTPIKITVSLCDDEQCYEQESAWIKLHHYPFFSNDAMIQVQEETRQPNTAPKGDIILRGTQPQNFSAVKMYIYYGDWLCNQNYAIADPITCTFQNIAPKTALAYTYIFYKEVDFKCSGQVCDFSYDLKNYYHYTNEGYYTTFAEVVFKTTDANSWIGRTIYPIGKVPLNTMLEFQGYDPEQYADVNCIGNIGGVTIAEIKALPSEAAMEQRFFNSALYYLFWNGTWSHADAQILWDSIQTTGEIPLNSPFWKYTGETNCRVKISNETNLKLVAKVSTAQWDDIHLYLVGSFDVTKEGDSFPSTPRFYPVEQFYNVETGQNILMWNTNLYDWNGNRLCVVGSPCDYNVNVYFEDQSMRNLPATEHMELTIDNSFVVTQPQTVEVIPLILSATETDTGILTLRTWIQTRKKYIDKIEWTIYTNNSSFDLTKTDAENQIIRFDTDAEELLKLEENPNNLDANALYSKFKMEHVNADMLGACGWGGAIGGVAAGALMIVVAAGVSSTGVGIPVGVVLGTAALGVIGGCAGGGAIAEISGDIQNSQLNADVIKNISDANYARTKEITIQFKNLRPNDYAETLAIADINESEAIPSTLINELHAKNMKSTLADVEVYVNGKKYTFENVLVGEGTLIENLKRHGLKLRMKVYYDYFQQTTVASYDIVTFSKPETGLGGFGEFADYLQNGIIYAFNFYAPLIIGVCLVVAFIVFVYPIFVKSGGKKEG